MVGGLGRRCNDGAGKGGGVSALTDEGRARACFHRSQLRATASELQEALLLEGARVAELEGLLRRVQQQASSVGWWGGADQQRQSGGGTPMR